MKFALFFVFFLSFGFSSDNYVNDSHLETDKVESSFANEMADFDYHELHEPTNDNSDCYCCNCMIIPITCSCTSFEAQWCDCDLYEDPITYAMNLCAQACP